MRSRYNAPFLLKSVTCSLTLRFLADSKSLEQRASSRSVSTRSTLPPSSRFGGGDQFGAVILAPKKEPAVRHGKRPVLFFSLSSFYRTALSFFSFFPVLMILVVVGLEVFYRDVQDLINGLSYFCLRYNY